MAAGGHLGWPIIPFDRISRRFRSIRNFFFYKMAATGHFGWPKITFDRISRHFRSIRNVDFFFTKWLPAAILDDRKSLSITFLTISDPYATYIFFKFHKMAAGGHFGWTENHLRSHFSPFQINMKLFYFVHKMAAGGHFGWPKITFDRISRHFRSIRNFCFLICSQNGCWRPFWMAENHLRSHFSPFQINTQFFFSQNGCRRPFWMTENHLRSHFSPFQINTQLFNFLILLTAAHTVHHHNTQYTAIPHSLAGGRYLFRGREIIISREEILILREGDNYFAGGR